MFYLCFYIWMSQNRVGGWGGGAGGGRRRECRWCLCGAVAGGEEGEKHRMPPAIHMSVMCSASEGAETMPVTVGDGDSWSSHHSRPPARPPALKSEWENVAGGNKSSVSDESKQHSQAPWMSRRDKRCGCGPQYSPNSSVPHQFALPGGFTCTSIGDTRGCAAKPCNLCALSFLPAWIWIWKGTISFSRQRPSL